MTDSLPATHASPSILGILSSVGSMFTPLGFPPAQPNHASEPYRPSRVGRGIPPIADIYLPPGPGPHPSMVLVHGGGWVIGHRRMKAMRHLATTLVQAGYAVFVPEYRMVFRGGRLTEALDDATTAIAWWLDNAERFGLDRARVSMSGLSAGATLMLLAAEQHRESGLASLLPVFGVYDFSDMHGGIGRLIRPLFLRGADPKSVSPLHMPPPACPVTLFHGTADTLVPYSQAVALRDAWSAAGGTVELVTYPGLPHAYFNYSQSEGCRQATSDYLAAL
ncbi:MAG: alpha/beta hydrolase [Deltaproteobacteria bacterium]|nr:alpha/beta hydrolase [Deltaproteobacteria bacterium]